MNDLNRNSERLNNIHAIEPILSALRSSSLARWHSALNNLATLKTYRQHLDTILSVLVSSSLTGIEQATTGEQDHESEQATIVWIVGSERRLCGDFNAKLVGWVNNHLTGDSFFTMPIELIVTGKPLFQLLQQQQPMADTVRVTLLDMSLSDQQALGHAQSWFRRYIGGEVRAMFGVHNQYAGIDHNRTICESLLPLLSMQHTSLVDYEPEPIVETDSQHLFIRVVNQLYALQIITMLTESTAAENATRYQIMESAIDNVEQLVDELEIAVHAEARRSITREIQTLMSASGLYR